MYDDVTLQVESFDIKKKIWLKNNPLYFQIERKHFAAGVSEMLFFIHIKIYNISYILQNFPNYFTTLQGRHHGERKTMTTPWPIYKDEQVNLPTTQQNTNDSVLH